MKYKESNYVLKNTVIDIETNTYEIIREIQNDSSKNGKEVVIIQAYPTISVNDADGIDSTTMHLLNKMKQLEWTKVHMLNLFSEVAKRKPLASNLKMIDTENIAYIENVFKTMPKDTKVIICWGNSLVSNIAANKSKKQILEKFFEIYPKGKLYHIVTDTMTEMLLGTHILFLGLRYANSEWMLEEYPAKEELQRISAVLASKADNKEKTKAERRKRGKNVSEDNEPDGCNSNDTNH